MNTKTLALGAAFMASVSLTPSALAGDSSFGAQPLKAGYTLADNHADGKKCEGEGKCGDGKICDGKCGSKDKKAEGVCGGKDKKAEGACGAKDKKAEGACGAKDKKTEGACGAKHKAEKAE